MKRMLQRTLPPLTYRNQGGMKEGAYKRSLHRSRCLANLFSLSPPSLCANLVHLTDRFPRRDRVYDFEEFLKEVNPCGGDARAGDECGGSRKLCLLSGFAGGMERGRTIPSLSLERREFCTSRAKWSRPLYPWIWGAFHTLRLQISKILIKKHPCGMTSNTYVLIFLGCKKCFDHPPMLKLMAICNMWTCLALRFRPRADRQTFCRGGQEDWVTLRD